jgi:hypothetical protein
MPRISRPLAVLTLCALLAACSAVTAAPRPVASTLRPGHLLVGAADSSYQAFVTATGVRPAIVEHYIPLWDPLPVAFAGPAEPLVQVLPRRTPLAGVAAGKYDDRLRNLAADAKAYGKPLILGFAPEMNGPWYTWGYKHVTPALYVDAWQHVVTLFRQAGAANVAWLWTVNVASPGVSAPADWWPGQAYVGMVGLDGYFDTASMTYGNRIAPTVAAVRKFWGGPVILSETAAAPAAGQAAKIRGLFAGAKAGHLAAVVLFDLPGNKQWSIDGNPAALAAFRKAAGSA